MGPFRFCLFPFCATTAVAVAFSSAALLPHCLSPPSLIFCGILPPVAVRSYLQEVDGSVVCCKFSPRSSTVIERAGICLVRLIESKERFVCLLTVLSVHRSLLIRYRACRPATMLTKFECKSARVKGAWKAFQKDPGRAVRLEIWTKVEG